MISQYHVAKKSFDFIGGNSSKKATRLIRLVAIGIVVVEM